MKKCIPVNLVQSVTMTSENADFPATQLLNEHPQEKARATTDSTTIIANVAAGSNGLMLAGTNAESATITVSSPHEAYFADDSFFADNSYFVETGSIQTKTVMQTGSSNTVACFFTQLTGPIVVKIDVAVPTGSVVEAGCLSVGAVVNFSCNPRYGLQETGYDYSTTIETDSGAFYSDFEPGDSVRMFSGSILLPRDETRTFQNIYHTHGQKNMPWWVTDLEGTDWLLFGRLGDFPSTVHQYYKHSEIAVNLIGAI